jgi:pimeloyl-ACP methyl ester carboxylesterase
MPSRVQTRRPRRARSLSCEDDRARPQYCAATADAIGEDIERLKQFAGEVLVVWDDADSYINVEQAEQQRRIFRRARIEHVPGAGHWPWLEQPDWVAACVSEFLRNQTAEPSKNG